MHTTSRPIGWIFILLLTCAVLVMGASASPAHGKTELSAVAADSEQERNVQAQDRNSPQSATESGTTTTGTSTSTVSNTATPGQKTNEPKSQVPETEKTSTWLEFLKIVISWPVAFALVVLYLALSKLAPYKLARLLKPFRSLKLFGTEFVLSEEVGTDAEQAIEIYRKQVKRQFDTLVEINDIRAKLEAVMDQVQTVIGQRKKIKDLRCTIHVPDILFADTLYQLLDYFPRGVGRGRTFSSRFGIIGLCWRSREPEIRGTVPTSPRILVRDWGMTYEEALASGEGRQSFVAVLICDETDSGVAIFYLDSKEQNAFGADTADEEFRSKLTNAILTGCKQKGLIISLVKMRDALKERRPAIRIHEK